MGKYDPVLCCLLCLIVCNCLSLPLVNCYAYSPDLASVFGECHLSLTDGLACSLIGSMIDQQTDR